LRTSKAPFKRSMLANISTSYNTYIVKTDGLA
jgi:hypothetical protein